MGELTRCRDCRSFVLPETSCPSCGGRVGRAPRLARVAAGALVLASGIGCAYGGPDERFDPLATRGDAGADASSDAAVDAGTDASVDASAPRR